MPYTSVYPYGQDYVSESIWKSPEYGEASRRATSEANAKQERRYANYVAQFKPGANSSRPMSRDQYSVANPAQAVNPFKYYKR